MASKKRPSSGKPGSTRTKKIEAGPNKGDTVVFGFGPSGKPYPKRVVRDVGAPSTLKDNPGVQFGKAKKKAAARKRLRSKMT